jgi:competence protein ComEC
MSVAAPTGVEAARPDLRLYGVAVGAWVACLAALFVGPGLAFVAGAGALIGAGALLWLARSDSGAVAGAIAAALLGIACGAAATGARTAARDAEPIASLARAQASVRAELTVTDDPRLVPATAGPPTYVVAAELTRLAPTSAAGAVELSVRIVVFATDPGWRGLLPGQRVRAAGRLAPPRGGDLTAAGLRATGAPELVGRPSWIQRLAGQLRAGLQTACLPLPAEPGGLLPGLVIGDTSRLDPALAAQFKATGLTHLVAVSGANLAVILSVVLLLARRCRWGPWPTAALCGAALVGFVILARPSPSVLRAAAMGVLGLVALATGRPRAAAPGLAAAVIGVLLLDPALAADAGFALSVLATAGLVLLAPGWRDGLRRRGVPPVLAEALAVPAAAQVACAPVIAGLSGTFSLVAVPANLLAVPAVAPATLLGVGAAVVSPLWTHAAALLAWLGSWPARWLVWIAHTGAGIPIGTLPWPGGVSGGVLLGAVTVAVLVAVRRPVLRRIALVVAVAAAVGAAPVRLLASGWPPTGAVIVVCDVGQGDAIALPLDDGTAVVVDTGPEPSAVDSCLSGLGVRSVPLLVLTHFHADHIGGLVGALRGRQVGSVAVPVFAEPAAGARAVREEAAAARVPLWQPPVGWVFSRAGLTLTVLGPTRLQTGTSSDPNNNSLVVRVISHGVTMLLAGDAQTEEQHDLLSDVDGAVLAAQVLKVAHHGSSYQDPGFLDAVHPRVALVSVGAGNPYGHPNAALLSRLARGGARVLRTDLDGDLAVLATAGGIAVATHARTGAGTARNVISHPIAQGLMDRVPSIGTRPGCVQLWRHDARLPGCLLPRSGRGGAAGGAGRRGCRGGRPGRRPRDRGRRVLRRRDDRRRCHGGGESVAVRGPPGRRGPRGAGHQERGRGRAAGVRPRARPRG